MPTRVSICTPTFNRRPFFKGLIDVVMNQTYPKNLIEWIIVDDGTDKVGDLVSHIPFVKYVPVDKKMPLGEKRNFMHDQCSFKEDDAIIVYIDDDDFYPPQRVSHSVEKLTGSKALCAGSSEVYLWYNEMKKMYKFGPYGQNHATAGTFAFKRSLLKITRYEDGAQLAEEKFFLKDYTIPFIQLDPFKTILVFSHEQNTFDKRRLIDPANPNCKESAIKVKTFVKSKELQQFYTTELPLLLKEYLPGSIENKPDVLAEIKRRDDSKQKEAQMITITTNENKSFKVDPRELLDALKHKTQECLELRKELDKSKEYIKLLIENIKKRG
jgi:glycosyltransferase involved in cell wall biosynthesis